MKRAFVIWCGLFVLAFVNGAIRELAIGRVVAEPLARPLSALTAGLFFSAFVFGTRRWLAVKSRADALRVGALWLALTVLAETFVVGRWLGGRSWEEIAGGYDLSRGELWPLVLLWVALLPWLSRE